MEDSGINIDCLNALEESKEQYQGIIAKAVESVRGDNSPGGMYWVPTNHNPNDSNFIPFHDAITTDEDSVSVQWRWMDEDGNEICGTSSGGFYGVNPGEIIIDEAKDVKARHVEEMAKKEAIRIELETLLRNALNFMGSNAPVHVLANQFDGDEYTIAQGPGRVKFGYMIIRDPEHVMDNPELYARIIDAQQKDVEYTPNAQEITKQRTKRKWEEWLLNFWMPKKRNVWAVQEMFISGA